MIDAIRSEWIKFRSVRSTVILVLTAGALVILVAVLASNSANHDAAKAACGSIGSFAPQGPNSPCQTHLGDISVGVSIAAFLFGVLGVQIIGQEYRFNTIRTTFTAVPRRGRVLAAKLVVVTAATALVSVVMLAVTWAIGTVMVHHFSVDSLDQRVILGTVLFGVGWTALGMGVGSILRQPIAGMVALLLDGFVVEQLLAGLVHASGPWLPFLNGLQMTRRNHPEELHTRSVLAGGIYFFVVAALLWGVGAYLASRRDA